MNTVFKALLALLALCVVAAVMVTVFVRKNGEPVGEVTTTAVTTTQEETTQLSEESSTEKESTPERTTVKEEISKLDKTVILEENVN